MKYLLQGLPLFVYHYTFEMLSIAEIIKRPRIIYAAAWFKLQTISTMPPTITKRNLNTPIVWLQLPSCKWVWYHFTRTFIDCIEIFRTNLYYFRSTLQIHAENCQNNANIDLHYLHVSEAKEALDIFLDSHIQKLKESNNKGPRFHKLFIITGRGLHSSGGPRVKPAVRKRLIQRGLE